MSLACENYSKCHLRLCMVAQVLASVLSTVWANAGDHGYKGPHCSSTFHVWQPGQEAQQMIRDVYLKMDNLTSYTKFEIADVRAHLANEMNRVHNWTYAVDKRVFQMQINRMDDELTQMKFSASTSKIQMQLDHVNRRVDDLERSMYTVRSKLRSGRSSSSNTGSENVHEHYDHLPQQQGLNADMGAMLKNSVGDLKAEWILLKRDMESLKKESLNLLTSQHEIRNDTSSLKASLDTTTSETKELEIKVYEIADQQERLEAKLERVVADTEQMRQKLDQYKADVNHYGETVVTLQSTTTTLQSDLSDVHIKLAHMSSGRNGHYNHERNHRLESEKPSQNAIPLVMSEDNETTDTGIEAVDEARETGSDRSSSHNFPRDCHDVYLAGHRVSSVYHILPDKARYLVPVYCEIVNNTGYTLIQRRIDGTIGFNKRWSEYKEGFGNPYGEIWAGNELIHLLTKQKSYTLFIDLWDWEGEKYYAEYSTFYVEGEHDQYKLHIADYSGNAGDSLAYHNKMAFSTEDMDNDLHERHCAAENKGGWWYHSCFYSQLNGLYHTAWYSQTQSNYADGVVWFTLKDNEFYSLKKVEMKLRPNNMASG